MESIVKQLRAACEDCGDVEFRESYSGRAMYGRGCVGIVGSMHAIMAVLAEVTANLTQEVFDAAVDCEDNTVNATYNLNDTVQDLQRKLFQFSYDSMGLDVIVYWPSIKPESEEDE